MARRRYRVPFPIWLEVFKRYNNEVATLLRNPEIEKHVMKVPYGGATVRLVLNHYFLKLVHAYLAQGASPDEAIKKAAEELLTKLTKDEIEKYVTARGFQLSPEQLDELYAAIRAILSALASGAPAAAAATPAAAMAA